MFLVATASAVRRAQCQFARARFRSFKCEEASSDFDGLLVGLQKCFAIGALLKVLFECREVSRTEIRGEVVSDQGSFFVAGQRPSSPSARLVVARRADPVFA